MSSERGSQSKHVSTIGLRPTHCPGSSQGPEARATHAGLDFVSTGHQAKISQVPLCMLPTRRQRPVFTPAGLEQRQCQKSPGSVPHLAPSPGHSRPHHFQLQQAPQEDSPCLCSTRHPECFHSARKKGHRGGRIALRSPSSEPGPTPGISTGVPPLGGHTPFENLPPPEQHRYAHPLGHSEGVETPASGEGRPPPLLHALPPPPPFSAPHQTSAQVSCRWLGVTIKLVTTKKTFSP